jgi:hypothetical protein
MSEVTSDSAVVQFSARFDGSSAADAGRLRWPCLPTPYGRVLGSFPAAQRYRRKMFSGGTL